MRSPLLDDGIADTRHLPASWRPRHPRYGGTGCKQSGCSPLLYPRLVFSPAYAAIRTAINISTPLVDAMAAYHQVPKSLIRILRGVKPGDIGPWNGDLDTLLSLCAILRLPGGQGMRRPGDFLVKPPGSSPDCLTRRSSARPIAFGCAPVPGTATRYRSCRRPIFCASPDIDEFMRGLQEALRWQLRDLATDQPVRSGGHEAVRTVPRQS